MPGFGFGGGLQRHNTAWQLSDIRSHYVGECHSEKVIPWAPTQPVLLGKRVLYWALVCSGKCLLRLSFCHPSPQQWLMPGREALGMHRWQGKTDMSKGRGHFLEREEEQVTLGLASQYRVFHKHINCSDC